MENTILDFLNNQSQLPQQQKANMGSLSASPASAPIAGIAGNNNILGNGLAGLATDRLAPGQGGLDMFGKAAGMAMSIFGGKSPFAAGLAMTNPSGMGKIATGILGKLF